MQRFLVGLLGFALSFSAVAGNALAVRKSIEGSMRVTGDVVIAADGSLMSYTIDRPEALPAEVKSLLARYLSICQFEVRTASGKPETVKAKMSLQLIARQKQDGTAVISINSSVFEDPDTPQHVVAKDMSPPMYPKAAQYAGLTGTVYLVLRLNPDGTVAQAHVEQVNMTVVGSEPVMRQGRRMFAEAALSRARRWIFEIEPQRAAEPGQIGVRVPVDFKLSDLPAAGDASNYGKWQSYVPGPYAPVPWMSQSIANDGVGAMLPGRLYSLDPPIKLRDPPTGS